MSESYTVTVLEPTPCVYCCRALRLEHSLSCLPQAHSSAAA